MPPSQRPRLHTVEGSRPQAFGSVEWLLLAAVALMWGASFLFIAEALETMTPGLITFGRLGLGALTLTLAPSSRRRVERSDWPQLLAMSVIWMAIPFSLFPIAQQWVSSSVAGMLNGAMPIFSAGVAAIMLRRPPGSSQVVGISIGFVGVALVSLAGGSEDVSSALGVGLVLVAVACYGVGVNLAVPLQQKYGALPVLWRALGVATLLTAPFALPGLRQTEAAPLSILALLALGVFGTGIAFVAMANLVGRAGATRAAAATYFIPLVAVVLGVTLRGESIVPAALAGIALILVGAALVSRREGQSITDR